MRLVPAGREFRLEQRGEHLSRVGFAHLDLDRPAAGAGQLHTHRSRSWAHPHTLGQNAWRAARRVRQSGTSTAAAPDGDRGRRLHAVEQPPSSSPRSPRRSRRAFEAAGRAGASLRRTSRRQFPRRLGRSPPGRDVLSATSSGRHPPRSPTDVIGRARRLPAPSRRQTNPQPGDHRRTTPRRQHPALRQMAQDEAAFHKVPATLRCIRRLRGIATVRRRATVARHYKPAEKRLRERPRLGLTAVTAPAASAPTTFEPPARASRTGRTSAGPGAPTAARARCAH